MKNIFFLWGGGRIITIYLHFEAWQDQFQFSHLNYVIFILLLMSFCSNHFSIQALTFFIFVFIRILRILIEWIFICFNSRIWPNQYFLVYYFRVLFIKFFKRISVSRIFRFHCNSRKININIPSNKKTYYELFLRNYVKILVQNQIIQYSELQPQAKAGILTISHLFLCFLLLILLFSCKHNFP